MFGKDRVLKVKRKKRFSRAGIAAYSQCVLFCQKEHDESQPERVNSIHFPFSTFSWSAMENVLGLIKSTLWFDDLVHLCRGHVYLFLAVQYRRSHL